jgi:nucleotide-binding universal stress UspA family protein
MTNSNRKILVPYDYTELSDFAIKHAINIAKIVNADIYLLHVIEDITEEIEHAKRLNEIAEANTQKYGVHFETKIRSGIIHKVIKTIAVAIDAFVVVMSTHPLKGKERYFVSRSVRVMSGSKIPFIVVQDKPKRLGLRNIVFPINFRKENKEKLIWISTLSKFYTSKIHFFKPSAKDYRVKSNLEFAKRFLEGKTIDYEIIAGKKSILDPAETLEYAHSIDSELIIIVLRRNISKISNLLGFSEQQFISNKYKIPIMVINTRTELHKYEGFH